MAVIWKKTNFLGVRYREHKTRKHGGNRPDKCFSIRYKLDGLDKEEVIGWSSEGVTAEKAFKILSQIRENIKNGTGPRTCAEMRETTRAAEKAEEEAQKRLASDAVTFGQFWQECYFPKAQASKKASSCRTEAGLYKIWLESALADVPLRDISASMIEKIVARAKTKHRSPATIRYILAVVSQVWNNARRDDIVSGECPTRKLKKPQKDNRRTRFLSEEEAASLLAELRLHSADMHDIAFLSLYTGMRAGEIHALQWKNVNFQADTIEIMDPKSGKNRFVIMTPEIKAMLQNRKADNMGDALVFPGKGGKKRRWVSDTFERAVTRLGFNNSGEFEEDEEGNLRARQITDARQKVVFHTLRHTFASWLVQRGVPLYTVAELMGHSTIEMTKRYSHLAPDTLRSAVMCLSKESRII